MSTKGLSDPSSAKRSASPMRSGPSVGPAIPAPVIQWPRAAEAVNPLDLIAVAPLMHRTEGRPEVIIGLIDGAVLLDHPDLAGLASVKLPRPERLAGARAAAAAERGTFGAGVLSAKRACAPRHLTRMHP